MEEVGVKQSFRRNLVRSRLKWAGHGERTLRPERKKKRGRPRLRWENCVKRIWREWEGVEKEGEGYGEWRRVVETAIKRKGTQH